MPAETRTFEGLFSGRYRVAIATYDGPDTSRVCYLFSGQGGIRPEPFRSAWNRGGAIRARFEQAEAVALRIGAPSPSSWFLDDAPPATAAARTLALFTLQTALYDEVIREAPPPRLVSGFSVGEFAALVASGIARFDDLFEVLAFREKCSPADNALGFMIAVAAPAGSIDGVLARTDCFIANRNAPGQTVIAVRAADRTRAEKTLRRARLPFRTLEDVPQPFHTPWMASVAAQVEQFVLDRQFGFSPPAVPILSSVTGKELNGGDTGLPAMARLIGSQIVEPVRFIDQVEYALAAGCCSFLEIGPAAILSSFVPQIAAGRFHKLLPLPDYLGGATSATAVRDTAELSSSRLFDLVRRVIARLTGYEIETISVEDRFQEDLGIDSIKKADIIFTVLDESGRELTDSYNAATIRDVADAVLLLDAAAPSSESATGPARTGEFGRFRQTWEEIALPPATAATSFRTVALGALLDGRMKPSGLFAEGTAVVLLADEGFSNDPLAPGATALDIERVERLMEGLGSLDVERDCELFLVTRPDAHPFAIGLAAMFKSLRTEMPRLFFKHIVVGSSTSAEEILDIASREGVDGSRIDVRWDGGRRSVATLRPMEGDAAARFEPGSVIAAFGGARGIALELLDQLAERGGFRFVLAGRSRGTDETIRAAEQRLARNGCEVIYEQCDARDRGAVRRVLEAGRSRWGRIDCVLNAVGVDHIAPLREQSAEDIRDTLTTKLLPAVHILEAGLEGLVERSLHFSSSTARYGNPGQTAYAFANEAMNHLVAAFNGRAGRGLAVSVNFPAWDGVGMTASPLVYLQLRRGGFALLGADAAIRLLDRDAVAHDTPVVDYADPSDQFLYEAPLLDQRPLRPLLGDPTLDHRFERILSPESEVWLRDHSIDGTCYLPAATMAAISVAAGEMNALAPLRCVEDLEITAPLAVAAPTALLIEVRRIEDGLTVSGRTTVPHFRCRLTAADALQTIEPFARHGEAINTGRLYRPGFFFHGTTFQTLHEAFAGSDGGLTVVVRASRLAPVYGLERYDLLTQWIDAAFQSLALDVFQRRRVMALPRAMERITVSADLPRADVQIVVRCTTEDDTAVRGTAVVATMDGAPLVTVDATLGLAGGPRP